MRKNDGIAESTLNFLSENRDVILSSVMKLVNDGNALATKATLEFLINGENIHKKSNFDLEISKHKLLYDKKIRTMELQHKEAMVNLAKLQSQVAKSRSDADTAIATKNKVEAKLLQLQTVKPAFIIEGFGRLTDDMGVIIMSLMVEDFIAIKTEMAAEDFKQKLLDRLAQSIKRAARAISRMTTEGAPDVQLEGIDDWSEVVQEIEEETTADYAEKFTEKKDDPESR